MHIRPFRPEDYAAWRPLWDGYNAFYGRQGDTALPEAVTEASWRRFLDPDAPMHALAAEIDGHIVGLAHVVIHLNTSALTPNAYLQDLFTDPAVRGQGVGRALIEAVYDLARAKGCGRVYWHTHETNATAMRLYDQVAEKSGFLVYRRLL